MQCDSCTVPTGTDIVWAGTPAGDIAKPRTARIGFRKGMIDYSLTCCAMNSLGYAHAPRGSAQNGRSEDEFRNI
jgi:hypothetical protein